MTNAYPAKVNRTVNYKTTISGEVKWRPAVITGGIPATVTVTASSRTSGVVTLSASNSLTTNGNILVSLSDATYNGLFQISARTGTTISYIQNLSDDASGGIGTILNIDLCNVRVGHHGETYSGISRRFGSDMHWAASGARTDIDKWGPG